MPLIVPGITSQSGDKTEQWQNKLVGKTLSENQSNETVRLDDSYSTPLRFFMLID